MKNHTVVSLVVVFVAVFILIVYNYTWIRKDEFKELVSSSHTLNQKLNVLKKNLSDKEIEIEVARSALKTKDERIGEFSLRQDKLLDMLDQCIKQTSAAIVGDSEIKKQLGKLQDRLQEQEKTAVSNFVAHEDAIKGKDEKINELVKKVVQLTEKSTKCQSEKSHVTEKFMDCENKLSKTWF